MEKHSLPKLDYEYNALEPHMSKEQLTIHHTKHHQGYVNGCNKIMETLAEARKNNTEVDMKSTLKALAFNIGGHKLHSLMWKNFTPNGKPKPEGELLASIEKHFGSFERFKTEFTQAAASVEGYFDVAILDRHIVNLMVEHGLLKEGKKSFSRPRYLEAEGAFKNLAAKMKMSCAELDLYMWYLKAGDVLK